MGFLETIIFYLFFGFAVAVAAFLQPGTRRRGERWFRVLTAVVFWPLYLPVLLAGSAQRHPVLEPPAKDPQDSLEATIGRVEQELASAISGLDGWAEGVLAREQLRLEELQRAWRVQAERIREMDKLLRDEDAHRAAPGLSESSDRAVRSGEARRQNIERLQEVRRRAHEDLMGTLAWVRELVSMIQLAKFTGAPASRAEELVAQIAASVEGLSEVSGWK